MDGPAGVSLSLVIPAYNEAPGIARAVAEADDALTALGWDYEILVVDDGSQDGTAARVRQAVAGRPRVRLLMHDQNRGYGAALRTGFEAARFDLIAFTDADCQFHLEDLNRLVPLVEQHDVAAGYRVDRQDNALRRFYSWGYNRLVQALLGTRIRDCDCALKVFRRSAVGRLLPESRGFFVNAEMLTRARQLGLRVAEAGVRHRPRAAGASKVSLLDVPRVLAVLFPFWWSRVVFAGVESREPRAQSRSALADPGFWVVVAVAALLFFGRLRTPLLEPEEARYAEIPRQMLAGGSWLVPVLHAQPYVQKPPLLYWLVMASYQFFGVHDWAARLVACAAAFATVLLAYAWARRAVGARAALAGALVLCLSARFVYVGRMLTMDGLLCACVVAGWACAHRALACKRLRPAWWAGSAVACGMGLLAKGPVAIALVAVPLVFLRLLDRRGARVGWRAWLTYGCLALGVAGPWYAALALREPTALAEFFWTHNVVRFLTPIDHQEPAYYYLPVLLLGMLPWTLLVPPMLRLLGRHGAPAVARRPPALGFFLLTGLWCLAFFSLSGCKRPGYILPAMPPLALALGVYIDGALPRDLLAGVRAGLARHALVPHRATLVALAGGAAVCALAAASGVRRSGPAVALAVGGALALAYLWRRGPANRAGTSWALCAGVTFALLLTGVHELMPGYAHKFSLRSQVRPQRDLSSDPAVPVVCYPHGWDSVSFYLKRNDVRVYPAEKRRELVAELLSRPETLVFVKTGPHLRDLVGSLPPHVEFVTRAAGELVTAGVVRPVTEAPESVVASR